MRRCPPNRDQSDRLVSAYNIVKPKLNAVRLATRPISRNCHCGPRLAFRPGRPDRPNRTLRTNCTCGSGRASWTIWPGRTRRSCVTTLATIAGTFDALVMKSDGNRNAGSKPARHSRTNGADRTRVIPGRIRHQHATTGFLQRKSLHLRNRRRRPLAVGRNRDDILVLRTICQLVGFQHLRFGSRAR